VAGSASGWRFPLLPSIVRRRSFPPPSADGSGCRRADISAGWRISNKKSAAIICNAFFANPACQQPIFVWVKIKIVLALLVIPYQSRLPHGNFLNSKPAAKQKGFCPKPKS